MQKKLMLVAENLYWMTLHYSAEVVPFFPPPPIPSVFLSPPLYSGPQEAASLYLQPLGKLRTHTIAANIYVGCKLEFSWVGSPFSQGNLYRSSSHFTSFSFFYPSRFFQQIKVIWEYFYPLRKPIYVTRIFEQINRFFFLGLSLTND